jgi:hypothetical protein
LEEIYKKIDRGFDITVDENYLFRWAAGICDVKLVKYLTYLGGDVTCCENYVIHPVFRLGNFELMKFLIENGADPSGAMDDIDGSYIINLKTIIYLYNIGVPISDKYVILSIPVIPSREKYISAVKYLHSRGVEKLGLFSYRDRKSNNPELTKYLNNLVMSEKITRMLNKKFRVINRDLLNVMFK